MTVTRRVSRQGPNSVFAIVLFTCLRQNHSSCVSKAETPVDFSSRVPATGLRRRGEIKSTADKLNRDTVTVPMELYEKDGIRTFCACRWNAAMAQDETPNQRVGGGATTFSDTSNLPAAQIGNYDLIGIGVLRPRIDADGPRKRRG